jgi:hypothetical protein
MRAFSLSIFSLISLGSFAFYLWGKIQIDFAVRKNAGLERQYQSLQHDIDNLRVDINTLKSYQRITDTAQEQGLVFLEPDRIDELPVDLSGLKPDRGTRSPKTVLAEEAKKMDRLFSVVLEGSHGTR